jgi:hypothetical protein
MTRRYLNQAIKKAASGEAAQYLFRCGGFKLAFDFIAFFLPRSGLVQQVKSLCGA